MSAPLLWIFLPTFFSMIALFFSRVILRIRWIYLVLIMFFLISSILLGTYPSGAASTPWKVVSDFSILGRIFSITESVRPAVIFLFTLLLIWEFISLFQPAQPQKSALRMAGTTFLVAALSVKPILYAALLIQISVIAFILSFALDTQGLMRGARKLVVMSSLAMWLFLLIGWQLSGGNIAPVDENQLRISAFVISLSFLLWLGVFPFNAWILALSSEHNPFDTLSFLTIFSTAIVLLFQHSLDVFSWFREYPSVFPSIRALGIMMAIVNVIPLVIQPLQPRSLGYWSGYSLGVLLVAISINTPDTQRLSLCLLMTKNLAMAGLGYNFSRGINPEEIEANPPISLFDWSVMVISIGTLSGIPLLASFPFIFHLVSALYGAGSVFTLLLLMSIGVSWIAFGKVIRLISGAELFAGLRPKSKFITLIAGIIFLTIANTPPLFALLAEKFYNSFIAGI